MSDAAKRIARFSGDTWHLNSPDRVGKFLESLADHVGLGLLQIDKDMRLLEANEHFCRQFDLRGPNLSAHNLYEFLHPRDHLRLRFQLGQLVTGRQIWFVEEIMALCRGDLTRQGNLACLSTTGRSNRAGAVIAIFNLEAFPSQWRYELTGCKVLSTLSAKVLEKIAIGESTVEIAAKLNLSRQGVDYHLTSMFRKFDVSNRATLVARAFVEGMLSGATWPPRVPDRFIK